MYLLPQFIQNAMLLPVAMTGIIMLPGGLVNAIVSAISGRMYDNIGAKGPESADGSTIMNTLQQIVGAIATAVATSLLGAGQAAHHTAGHAAAFASGVHYGFYFTVCLAIVGLVLATTLKNKPNN